MDTTANDPHPAALTPSPLTPSQREAVEHVNGPMLILAGPGSGKTRVVTHRVANLIAQGVPPWQILALTFTNKAAEEMKSRLTQLVPNAPVWMGTFHRFCARILRQYAALVGLSENYSIYDMDDAHKLLKLTLEEEQIDLTHASPDAVSQAISWAKNQLLTPDRYAQTAKKGNAVAGIVERAYPAYQKRLLQSNAVDFDDMLLHVAVLLQENPAVRATLDEKYRYILVDEYQDTNLAQYAIVRALSINYPNLSVTGDPDQSIYGWRGATLSNILDFEKDFGQVKVVRLEQNYRSTKSILRVADALIVHNVRRKQKNLFTDNPEGAPVKLFAYPTHKEEADDIAGQIAREIRAGRRRAQDFAIFYRTNALSRQMEHALRDHVIGYQIVNGLEFFQRKEIKDVMAYLNLINNPRSDIALMRVINTPVRGIGKSSISRLQEYASQRRLPLLEAARKAGVIEGLPKKAAVSIAKFVAMLDRVGIAANRPVEEIVGLVLAESGYAEALANSGTEEDQERLANVQELLSEAREYDIRHPSDGSLEQFLENASLVADTDAWESASDKVTLMTMHAAKGLEFPVVFIIACEEGILPHERSRQDPEKLEEERRLLFVGITRAEAELQLSYAHYRMFRGNDSPTVPSSFLMELPREEMQLSSSVTGRMTTPDWDVSQVVDELPDEIEAERAGDMVGEEDLSNADVSFDVDDFAQVEVAPQPKKKAKPLVSGMVTAADLLAQEAKPRLHPSKFKHGMLVSHAEYGIGKIIALSGEGVKRVAHIRFLDDESEKKFRLMFADLTPVED